MARSIKNHIPSEWPPRSMSWRSSCYFREGNGPHLQALDSISRAITPDDPELADWSQSYFKWHRRRLSEDMLLVERYASLGSRVLEIGSTPPFLTAALNEIGYQITGVDLHPERFGAAIRSLGLEVLACDIETESLPFQDHTFDCILFNEVFEHLRINPVAAVAELKRLLRPGGLLLMSTPNLFSYRGIRNFLLHQHAWAIDACPFAEYRKLSTLGHMGHVREYTPVEIKSFMLSSGFEVEDVLFRGTTDGWLETLVTAIRPSLRPFLSLIARTRET